MEKFKVLTTTVWCYWIRWQIIMVTSIPLSHLEEGNVVHSFLGSSSNLESLSVLSHLENKGARKSVHEHSKCEFWGASTRWGIGLTVGFQPWGQQQLRKIPLILNISSLTGVQPLFPQMSFGPLRSKLHLVSLVCAKIIGENLRRFLSDFQSFVAFFFSSLRINIVFCRLSNS